MDPSDLTLSGICQIDDLIPIPTEEVKLGVRFFLQSENGRALAGMAWNGMVTGTCPIGSHTF